MSRAGLAGQTRFFCAAKGELGVSPGKEGEARRGHGGRGRGGGGKVPAEEEGAGEAGREGSREGAAARAARGWIPPALPRSLARSLAPASPAPSHPGPPHPPPLAQGLLEPGGARCRFKTHSAGAVPSLRNRPQIGSRGRAGGRGPSGGSAARSAKPDAGSRETAAAAARLAPQPRAVHGAGAESLRAQAALGRCRLGAALLSPQVAARAAGRAQPRSLERPPRSSPPWTPSRGA